METNQHVAFGKGEVEMKKKIMLLLGALCLIGVGGFYRSFAHTGGTNGHLALNALGANQIGANSSYFANGIVDSSTKWVFFPINWAEMETDAPTAGPCSGSPPAGKIFWDSGPSGQCHTFQMNNTDSIISTAQNASRYIAIGMLVHPTWAGGNPCQTISTANCARVYRSYLSTFAAGAKDFAEFLVSRYSPGAFSVWNEPNSQLFLSIEPPSYPPSSNYKIADYSTYLLGPIADYLHTYHSGILVMGPELATPNNDNSPGPENDGNWSGSPNTGTYLDWTDYILDNYSSKIDRWTLHGYGDNPAKAAVYPVGRTWTEMTNRSLTYYIWVTETSPFTQAPCDSNWVQSSYADWLCHHKNRITWDISFYGFAKEDNSCNTSWSSSGAVSRSGLMGDDGHQFPEKWLLTAFHALLDGNYSCSYP
jgi:hypothetical protein